MSLTIVRAGRPLRCAACHDGATELVACPHCGTALHAGCRTELGACPTLGCRSPRSVVVVPRPLPPTDWPFLALVGWLVLLPCAWLLQLTLHGLAHCSYGLVERGVGLNELLLWPTELVGPLGWVALGVVLVFGSLFVPPRRACLVFGPLAVGVVCWSALCLPRVLGGLGLLLQG